MQLLRVASCLVAMSIASPVVVGAEMLESPAKSAVTVADLAREVLIGDPFSTGWSDWVRRQHVSVTTPDGKNAAVVLRWGDIECSENIGSLLVYQTSELLRSPKPRKVAEFGSTSNHQPIALVRWLADSRTLVFAATDGEHPTQVYRTNIETSSVEPLTKEPNPVDWFDITPSGEHLVAISKEAAQGPEEDPSCQKEGCLVTARTLWAAQSGMKEGSGLLSVYDFEAGTRAKLASPENSDPDIESCADELEGGLSPDGRFGLRACMLKPGRWPDWWRDYDVDPNLSTFLSKLNNAYALRLIITELRSGENRTLTQAPYIWDQPEPIWLDGGQRLLLAGSLETLRDVTGAEAARRRSARSILVVDPVTGSYERVSQLGPEIHSVIQTRWDEDSQILTLETANGAGNPLPAVRYKRVGERWVRAPVAKPARHDSDKEVPHLVLHEALNTPATLVAIDPLSGMRKVVLDPNPWLAERRQGKVEEIAWTLKNGQKWQGGLYYPPDYTSGTRYPLVILTHGFDRDHFSLYGYARNFAAQPLASYGMLVLQVEEKLKSVVGTPEEWPAVQAGYEAAIDYLDSLGLIDRTRVGIQGWSRTGMHVGYTLTHSTYRFAAGALTSTGGLGWWWYIAAGAEPEYEADFGAAPFGEGLQTWLKISPGFNLDRVSTPMFMWENSSVVGLWDWYIGLRRLAVPVEYWYLPDGAHEVFRIRERMLTCQLLVDWFRFWLKDQEDADPLKAGQYARWRNLRKQRDALLKHGY